MQKVPRIEISPRTIIFTVFFLLGLQFVWLIRELILSLFIAFIVMSALNPAVSYLAKKRIPRGLSAIAIFAILTFFLSYILSWIIPPVVQETTQLLQNLPKLLHTLNPELSGYFEFKSIQSYIPNLTSNAFSIFKSLFSNLVFVISTFFFSLYFLIEENAAKNLVNNYFDKKTAERLISVVERIEKRMRAFFWGELTLMLIIGVMTFIGLTLIGVKYALPLAVIAGLLEAVPMLGPVLSAVPTFIVASATSYLLGLASIALYFIIQQSENQIVVPLVMKRAVGMNPIVTLAALIIGGQVLGFLGVLLAIPLTLAIEVVLQEFVLTKR